MTLDGGPRDILHVFKLKQWKGAKGEENTFISDLSRDDWSPKPESEMFYMHLILGRGVPDRNWSTKVLGLSEISMSDNKSFIFVAMETVFQGTDQVSTLNVTNIDSVTDSSSMTNNYEFSLWE